MKIINAILLGVLMTFAISCGSTKIISSWKEPNKKVRIEKLHKVLVLAFLKTKKNRHIAEDQMVAYLDGKGVASYLYLNDDINKSDKALHKQLKKDGFDAAVTMRIIDIAKDTIYRPGSFSTNYPNNYRNFDGYYSRNFDLYNTPNTYATTRTYTIETNVFSIKEDKIIWTGITKSIAPDGIDKMTGEIAKAVFKQMKREGFIVKK